MDSQSPQGPRLVGALLRVPFLTVMSRIRDALPQAGYGDLHAAHLPVFQQIDEETGSRLTDLAERALITKQSMGYLVDYLEEQGYVERVPDPSDGRGKMVRLTERGHGVMSTARSVVRELEEEWAGVVGERRMKELKETLGELVAMLEDGHASNGARHE
jgi:DNA-binding MarR family transcriptional regulator